MRDSAASRWWGVSAPVVDDEEHGGPVDAPARSIGTPSEGPSTDRRVASAPRACPASSSSSSWGRRWRRRFAATDVDDEERRGPDDAPGGSLGARSEGTSSERRIADAPGACSLSASLNLSRRRCPRRRRNGWSSCGSGGRGAARRRSGDGRLVGSITWTTEVRRKRRRSQRRRRSAATPVLLGEPPW